MADLCARDVCGEHLGSPAREGRLQPGRQGVDGQKVVNFHPILVGDLKQPSLRGWLKTSFWVDEIPHFLNKSTGGRSSVTVVGAMPSFGWVGSRAPFFGYYHNSLSANSC